MNPITSVLIAVVIYAIMNVMMERTLARYTTAVLLVCFYSVMLPMAVGQMLYLRGQAGAGYVAPTGAMIMLALFGGFLYYWGDFFYLQGYKLGGNAFTITSIMIMLPPFTALINRLSGGGLPNRYQLAAYVFAAAAAMLAVKGQQITR